MIRKLQSDDIPQAMKMIQHNVEYHHELLKDETYVWSSSVAAHYESVLNGSLGSERSCVFFSKGKGFVHVCIKDNAAWIADIWVEPSSRQQGLAKELAKKAIRWAEERGKSTIYANISVKNDIGRRFYEAVGFGPEVIVMRKEGYKIK